MDIFQALADVSKERGLPFLVIGGHAINAYGYARETGDLDLLICKRDRDQWLSWFKSMNYDPLQDAESFVQLSPPRQGEWPVDLMLVAEPTFNPMLEQSTVIEVLASKPRIPSVEHLLALKLHALKHTRLHRFLKDFQDVVGLIECQKLDVKSEKVRKLFQKYANMDLYEKVARALS